jgi:CBS domain-containing protein
MIANLNDQVLIRLIDLLRQDRYPDLTDDFAFVVMGSEGRGEQTLLTDQDNAIIYADELGAGEISPDRGLLAGADRLLIAIGIPPCPGGIMASNKEWRRSLGKWRDQLDRWLQAPTPKHVLSCGTFVDIRTIYGDPSFEQELKTQVYSTYRKTSCS